MREETFEQAVELVTGLAGGKPPYRWQRRLLHSWLLHGKTPNLVDVPTGLGKTRVMALWLAARALGADLPRRLVYVVDRRAVVDQATEEADRLAKSLDQALDDLGEPFAAECRARLGLSHGSLAISTLRGQFADNRRWLDAPGAAAIVVGTVDMIGSRLLFEGYGVSPGMRPAHAGLIGADTLVLVDEAHLVPPFNALLRSAAGAPRSAPVPAMRVIALSATGDQADGGAVFTLEAEDFEDPLVKARLEAPKRLALNEVRPEDIVEAMAERAFELAEGGARVIVFCNSRDKLARLVADKLEAWSDKQWKGVRTTALLVGARRVFERDQLRSDRVFRRFLSDEIPDGGDMPAFLIATSAGEVGVDLDADHMVCDLVAWERMVQRLGRVNRTGRPAPAMAEVFWSRSVGRAAKEDAEDDPEGERIAAWRAPFESSAWRADADGRLPASPGAFLKLREDDSFRSLARKATTPEPLRPELTGPLVEAWAMTSLAEHPGRPRVAPWLRGWVKDTAQTRLVWRRVLPISGERPDVGQLKAFFSAFPPHLTEVLETETSLAADMLKARAADIEKHPPAEVDERVPPALAAVVLSPRNELEEVIGLADLADSKRLFSRLAAKTVVLDRRIGGLSREGLLDSKAPHLPRVLDAGEAEPEDMRWPEDLLSEVGRRLREVAPRDAPLDGWARLDGWPTSQSEDEAVLEWRIEKSARAPEAGDPSRSSRSQGLAEHLGWTAEAAREIGAAMDLPADYRQVLEIAAAAHDRGKDRKLWQDAVGADRDGRPYAKTTGWRANTVLLQGYRHEFGSLRDAEADFAAIEDEDLRELARHLVAAHHGYARPAILPFDPDEPPSASSQRAQAAALRFVRLQKRWGAWGLAWWEALMRAADWSASRRLAEEGRG